MSTLINRCRVHRGLDVLPELATDGAGPVALAHDAALDSNPGLAECRRLLADSGVEVRPLPVHRPRTLADAETLADRLAGTRLVVAVGGGSLLDTAKLALAVADPLTARIVAAPQRSGWVIGPDRPRPVPLVAVPTTLGTAAEASNIVSFVHGGQKRALTGLALQPDVALLDARCTAGLSGQLLVEGCLEIILRSVGPVVGSEGPWTDTDDHALRQAARVAGVLSDIRGTGTATAAQRAELADLSLATRRVELLRDRMPFTVKVWFLANNLSHHLGVRKMTALANLLPAYWSHLADRSAVAAQRVGRTWSALRAATPAAVPADPAEGFAAWLDLLGVAPAPVPGDVDIETVVRSCLRMWGGGLPMLAGLGAEDLRRMLGQLRSAHSDSRVPRG